jgi:hypothetical protein
MQGGDGLLARTYPTIKELTADMQLVVRATATAERRNAYFLHDEHTVTELKVNEVLKGDPSLTTIHLTQNVVPLHEDFPFPVAGKSYVLFLKGDTVSEDGRPVTYYGPFGMFLQGKGGLYDDLDPVGQLQATQRHLILDDLRRAIAE